ncbi:hypothetical protein K2173_023048 [Erythroxylum novogranatense]|uniref:Aspartic proteinase Asp1 n=1 Tax=Erythroxylum novogranatense TaxID=1862640 RepID=A0AAV8T9D3_9ROSI|nr:hypothetical protein K2173_023048 [Erythroxylum novogranatense]
MGKNSGIGLPLGLVLFFVVSTTIFRGTSSETFLPFSKKKSTQPTAANNPFDSSVLFKVIGNVYPLGYYAALVNIGNPPKTYDFDFDTGSDLSWVQCDAPCTSCTLPRTKQYRPNHNAMPCSNRLCQAINLPTRNCHDANDQCDYELKYADGGSSTGVLVMDSFPLPLINGTVIRPALAFGCGYHQEIPFGAHPSPTTAGVLGLGKGETSFVSQLRALNITKNVIGHCLSSQGGGFLFLGDHFVPSKGTSWAPMLHSTENYYVSGPADLLFGGKPTGASGLQLTIDSGSSYTYFSSQVYKTTLNLIQKDLSGKPLKDAPEDKTLPICWKGRKPFKSINDAKSYFQPLALSFKNAKNVQLLLPPEHYLIVSKNGNVCFGILNGTEKGLGNLNLIGDIFLQDKLVIYDNERQLIGWAPANCNTLPNVGRDYNEGFCQPYAANFGIIEDHCPAATVYEKPRQLIEIKRNSPNNK